MKVVAGRTFATRAQTHEARSIETKLRHETILLANGRGSASEYYLLVGLASRNLDDGREQREIENGATQNGSSDDQQAKSNAWRKGASAKRQTPFLQFTS